jgi:maleate cis-trans isomerase
VTGLEVRFLEAAGHPVLRAECLGIHVRGGQGYCQPEEVLRLARSCVVPGAEALVVSCTNLRTFEVIAELERETGLPVVTSNQATLWALLARAGREARGRGLGRLLELSSQQLHGGRVT